MLCRELRRIPASFPIIIHEYASSEYSAALMISDAKPDIGDAALYKKLFTYLEQPEDSVRSMTTRAGAEPDIGYTALYRQLFTDSSTHI